MQDEKPFKDLVKGLLKSYKLNDKYEELNVTNNWENIVGRQIASKTSKLFISKSILHLYITSAPLKNELNYYKHIIIEKVNKFAGSELVKDINIR
ncbi:MAG: DUF721 domain-containing protein [Bacteroidia bacterium]